MNMWEEFTDFELCYLAQEYGVAEQVVFTDRLTLANRPEIEQLLTAVEFEMAFGE